MTQAPVTPFELPEVPAGPAQGVARADSPVGSRLAAIAKDPEQTFSALATAHSALHCAEQRCRFHGDDFGRAGWWRGEPRCESCRQPWRVTEALKAIRALMGWSDQ